MRSIGNCKLKIENCKLRDGWQSTICNSQYAIFNLQSRSRPRAAGRSAFTLLEVILAIGILAVVVAATGEILRFGMLNAQKAKNTAKAELFCETKLAEIVSGYAPAQSTSGPIEEMVDPSDAEWMYTVDVASGTDQGLLIVTVTVQQDLPPEQRPTQVTLTRWMIDPSYLSSATSSLSSTSTTTTTE
jgi:type II secretion system protein I